MKIAAMAGMVAGIGLEAPAIHAAGNGAPDTLSGLPLVFEEGFEQGWDRWEIFAPDAWKLTRQEGNTFLQVPQLSGYAPEVRGPYNRALIRGLEVRDFILEARVRVTETSRGHRGGMFFFGYRDPSHFYYTHLATAPSDRSHVFAKVAGAPRFTFYRTRNAGIPWTRGWQTIRMVRKFDEGILEAYVDDMTEAVLTADDLAYRGMVHLYDAAVAHSGRDVPVTQTDRFEWGRVGIGSFQGIMDYDDVKLWAEVKGTPTRAARPGEGPAIRKGRSGGEAARRREKARGPVPLLGFGESAHLPDGRRAPRLPDAEAGGK